MTYVIFDPKVDRPLHKLPQEAALIAYDWFISNVPTRLDELSQLVDNDGISLDYSETSLSELHQWFFSLVLKERSIGNSAPSSELFSVCNDIGIYLAECVIKSAPQITWNFSTKDLSELSYHRPVISGFNVENPGYSVDFDYLICQYAFRILKTGKEDVSLFTAMVRKALSIA